jgi:hypothetical protein
MATIPFAPTQQNGYMIQDLEIRFAYACTHKKDNNV